MDETPNTKIVHRSVYSEDLEFIKTLDDIWKTDSNRAEKWIDACQENPEIQDKIEKKREEIRMQGWEILNERFDNEEKDGNKGLNVSFTIKKSGSE